MRIKIINKGFALLVCAACALALLLAAGPGSQAAAGEAAKAGPLRVGWAKTELSPDVPVHMAGSACLRAADKVVDPIMATVLVLESAGEQGSGDMLIMVCCDLARAEEALCDRVRELVAKLQPEIDVEKIIINAMHNHGAPCVRTAPELAAELAKRGIEVPAEWSYYGVDPDIMSPGGYLEFAAPRIAQAIARAWKERKPGGVSFGLGHAVVSHNRLVAYDNGRSAANGKADRPDFSHIEGYEDHTVGLLYTFDGDHKLTGVVLNVPCAARGMASGMTADFWHDTRVELRKRLGESLYVLQQTAASAEQWPEPIINRRAEERMQRLAGRNRRQEIAVRLADAVTSVLPYTKDQIEWNPKLVHRVERIKLTRRQVTKGEAESRRQTFERYVEQYRKMRKKIEADPKIREKPNWFREISGVYWRLARAYRVVRMSELQKTQPKLPVRVHVIRIGDMAMATFPLAPYLDFSIRIKARSKAVQTFTVQTADGHYRYLPTARSVAGNTYGAVPESTVFGPEGGRDLVEEILKLIESLWAEK